MVIKHAGRFGTKETIIMTENKQPWDKQDKNTEPMTTGQPYARSAGTSIGASLATEENGPTIKPQPDGPTAGATITPQPDAHAADKGMSPGLGRALVGGLIGATLGTLVGALANKRTAEGVNHAAKGVGIAVKSVAEGINQATKGVGVAVKSVAEGVNHAVIGGAVDAVKDTAEGVKQSVTGAVDAVKDTAEGAKQSVTGAVDAVKDTSEGAKPYNNQSFKLDQERVVTGNKQVTTGSVGIGSQVETATADIPFLVEEEGLIVAIAIPTDAETPVAPGEADFYQG